MKGKIIFISIIFLIGISAFAIADNFNVRYRVAVDEGWNLLQGFGAYSLISNFISGGGDIVNSDVVAIFAYLPNEKKYTRIYPNPQVKFDDKELLNSSFWVYLKKSGWIEYDVESEWAYADGRKMVAGWNLIGITKDMLRVKVKNWKGDCKIQKIAGYQRGWNVIDSGVDERTLADQEQDLGRGIIVKVSSDCTLRRIIYNLPEIPN